MGHAVEYFEYDYKTSTAIISADMNDRANREGDSGGLNFPIRFETRTPFEDEEAARGYIERIDRAYLQVAVPFYYYRREDVAEPQSLRSAREKEDNALRELYERDRRQYYTTETISSKTIGCKNCESKLAVKYLKSNRCPLCWAELRPESEMKRIEALRERYNKAKQTLEAETKKYEATVRAKGKPETRWLVKIEYHV